MIKTAVPCNRGHQLYMQKNIQRFRSMSFKSPELQRIGFTSLFTKSTKPYFIFVFYKKYHDGRINLVSRDIFERDITSPNNDSISGSLIEGKHESIIDSNNGKKCTYKVHENGIIDSRSVMNKDSSTVHTNLKQISKAEIHDVKFENTSTSTHKIEPRMKANIVDSDMLKQDLSENINYVELLSRDLNNHRVADVVMDLHIRRFHRRSIGDELKKLGVEIGKNKIRKILRKCQICAERDIKIRKTCQFIRTEKPGDKMGVN